jgi:hypothetical protein
MASRTSRFRIFQARPDFVRVQLVPPPAFDAAQLERNWQIVLHHMGRVEVRINLVDRIESDPGNSDPLRRTHRAFPLPNLD